MKILRALFCGFLVSSFLAAQDQPGGYWQKIAWTTPDGVRMVGLYRPASRPGACTWILLHGLGSSKEEWEAFGKRLAAQGNGVFLYDARGHNESDHLVTGEMISYQAWQTAGPGTPWSAMPSDLSFAVGMLKKKYGLSGNKFAVGGASLGANVALVYASDHPDARALVLLSPGMEYAGIQSGPAFQAYQGRPVFVAASPNDLYAYSSVRQLTTLAPGPHCTIVDGKNGHGVNMLDEEFTKTLLDWMRKQDGNRNRRPT